MLYLGRFGRAGGVGWLAGEQAAADKGAADKECWVFIKLTITNYLKVTNITLQFAR